MADGQPNFQMRDQAMIVGECFHISGVEGKFEIRVATKAFGVVICATTRDLAKAIGAHLFERIRVSGRALWARNDAGVWVIKQFTVTDFSAVEDETLRQFVARIRAAGIDWPHDVFAALRDIEEMNDG